jgi:hypothetical protein
MRQIERSWNSEGLSSKRLESCRRGDLSGTKNVISLFLVTFANKVEASEWTLLGLAFVDRNQIRDGTRRCPIGGW